MDKGKSSLQIRMNSFKHAARGIIVALKSELHMKLHLIAASFVIVAGVHFDITTKEWLAVVVVIGFVIFSELINTAIELLADYLTLEEDRRIKDIKDIAAGAVLISSLTAIAVALIIFGPLVIPHK
jgi:undecaprenol kinase/diacylglycerol kinase (ATP)